MNWLKIILFALILVFAVFLGLSVIGFLYSALWYLFWIGVIAIGGYIGYKFLFKGNKLEIEGRDPISQIELENAKVIKSLDDYKKKVNQ